MDYKPGLAAASINQGNKKSAINPFLDQLFSQKKQEKKKDKKDKALGEINRQMLKKEIIKDIGKLPAVKNANGKTKGENTTPVKIKKKSKDSEQVSQPAKLLGNGKRKLEDSSPVRVKKIKDSQHDSQPSKLLNYIPLSKKAKVETPEQQHLTTKGSKEDSVKNAKQRKATKDSSQHSQSAKVSNDFPYVHESLLKKQPSPKQNAKKVKKEVNSEDEEDILVLNPRRRHKRDKIADKRTVFVGNCPLSADKKIITKLFKEYGPIESMRFRCGPAASLELPRRATIIKKNFHEKASSYVCYVVFKDEASAQKALEKNGHVLDGLHLRIDLASDHKKHDKKRSVFVGNLPFDANEENLRTHFEDCGNVINVRIIKDKQTSIGKGFAYVQFETKDGVTLAKRLDDVEFEGRKLRVQTCTNKPKLDKPVKTVDKFNKAKEKFPHRSNFQPDKRKIAFAPSNRKTATPKPFHEFLQAKKDKRKKSMNKKRQGSQKSDGLSSIFGDMTADMKRLKMDNPKFREKKRKDIKGKARDKKAKDNRVKKMRKS